MARQLGLDKTVIAKLRRRQIELSTIPQAVLDQIATALATTRTVLTRFLAGAPLAGGYYKAPNGPQPPRKESFSAALENATVAARLRRSSSKDGSD